MDDYLRLNIGIDVNIFCNGGRWEVYGEFFEMRDDLFGEYCRIYKNDNVVEHYGFHGYVTD